MPIPQLPVSWSTEELPPDSHNVKSSPDSEKHQARQAQIRHSEQEPSVVETGQDKLKMQHDSAAHLQDGAFCTDRAELMARIKNGESPTWVPNETLQRERFRENEKTSHELPMSAPEPTPELGSAGDHEAQNGREIISGPLHSPFEIERPPSALHAGDFKEDFQASDDHIRKQDDLNASESQDGRPLRAKRCSRTPNPSSYGTVAPWAVSPLSEPMYTADEAPLSSFSSSNYVLKKPTTPLVQQYNNTDFDFSTRDRSPSPGKGNRRHTLPSSMLGHWSHSSAGVSTSRSPSNHLNPSRRPEVSFTRSHQARRSVSSTWSLQAPSSPPTPAFLRSCRTSISSEASSKQRASMVGSYEESILHGRMSTPPSKPFDFHAHIGALGRGDKPKMPPQVTVPFQAVFYDWASNTRMASIYDEPSPYVGSIDLRNTKSMSSSRIPQEDTFRASYHDPQSQLKPIGVPGKDLRPGKVIRPKKRKRNIPANVPEGSYRIPEQGQIQVVVKNPYKTALKLFLVPYDLCGITPGQKTFVRQRYYSAGPIIERPVTVASKRSIAQIDPKRPTLRYLIHLKMCCPTKGYHYLYGTISVVFANRVPDDKEHLTKELQEPNPKYSLWKVDHDIARTPTPAMKDLEDRAFRRRSAGSGYSQWHTEPKSLHSHTGALFPHADADVPPVPPLPFHLPLAAHPARALGDHEASKGIDINELSPTSLSDFQPPSGNETQGTDEHPTSDNSESGNYMKLSKGDAGYGNSYTHNGRAPKSGLLARQLKRFGTQGDGSRDASSLWD